MAKKTTKAPAAQPPADPAPETPGEPDQRPAPDPAEAVVSHIAYAEEALNEAVKKAVALGLDVACQLIEEAGRHGTGNKRQFVEITVSRTVRLKG